VFSGTGPAAARRYDRPVARTAGTARSTRHVVPWSHRIGRLIALVITVGAALALPPPSASAADTPVARLTLQTLEPRVVQPGDTLSLTGTLANTSDATLHDVTVVLRLSTNRITTRYDLAKDFDPSTITGSTIAASRQQLGDLAAGSTVSWRISVPVDRLGLPRDPDQFGAYPLAVEAHTADNVPGSVPGGMARLATALLWLPPNAHFVPTEISWVIPLVGGIHRGMGQTFLDDRLAQDLAPTGRLGSLLAAATHSRIPITYAIDPALIDDAAVMAGTPQEPPSPAGSAGSAGSTPNPPLSNPNPTSGAAGGAAQSPSAPPTASATPHAIATPHATAPPYTVRSDHGVRAGAGTAAADQWLRHLREALAAPDVGVFGLPYADVDLTALDHAGLPDDIAAARSAGQITLNAQLGGLLAGNPNVMTGTVWPVGGYLDTRTLDDIANDLVDTVVLSDDALPTRDPDAVPGIRVDLQTPSGRVTALLADSTLTGLLAAPETVPGGLRAAEQRFLAETMLVTEQRPGVGSALVVTPPRFVDPRDGFLGQLLADTAVVPWLRPVTLAAIAQRPPDETPRAGLRYPDAARQAELPASALARVPIARDALAAFTAILGPGTVVPIVDQANLGILRAESANLRPEPREPAAILNEVLTAVQQETAKVYISNPGLITLTSRTQKIPLTVVNQLPNPVTVRLRLAAVNPTRLTVGPIPELTVPANSRQDVLIEVTARTNGRFPVVAQLLTPDLAERPYGTPVSFQLNATAYGAVALTIAAGAAGLLIVWSAIRIWRRRRHGRHRRTPPTPAAGPPADDTAKTSVPGTPGELT
jgi:hypothetical protein